jgi:DNA-binding NarL/FixJ family response regulator
MRLTRRQRQFLHCVRRGMSSKEIARTASLTEGTVNNCITAAMRVLEVTSRSHAVGRALELGLLSSFSDFEAEPLLRKQ